MAANTRYLQVVLPPPPPECPVTYLKSEKFEGLKGQGNYLL